MGIRRFSSIGSPLVSAMRGRRFQSSLAESSRSLTPLECAFLSKVSPQGLPEAMRHPWGFKVICRSLGYPATSADLVVKTTYSISDGMRLSERLAEYSLMPVCQLFDLVALGLPLLLVDRTTGELGPVGALLWQGSTLRQTSQRAPMLERGTLSGGLRASR